MNLQSHRYLTQGGIGISRSQTEIPKETAIENILSGLNSQRGGLLSSSYEYPGRYKRWAIGFINPPLELVTRDRTFTVIARSDRGQLLLPSILQRLFTLDCLQDVALEGDRISGIIPPTAQCFAEEERSQQPSAFTVVRELQQMFFSPEDEHLGLYGAFGYDLVFQFEPIAPSRPRPEDQRDLVLYLPDELVIIDYYLQTTYRYSYDFEVDSGTTAGIPRSGEAIDFLGNPQAEPASYPTEDYKQLVERAMDYFRRGDLFEVVPSQNFAKACTAEPSELFKTLQRINPSPYGFIFNLGGEYIIGASPEMFVRVEGKCVETCPISGTITRGEDAIDDAAQIRLLLNSHKDEAELTMCTDVDRNDKSRICEPGSVRVIGRRQIELYSHLIHTVDHVEGILRPEFDALDAFLSHTWAVTVTGAPKPSAIKFVEAYEQSCRRWYGGAVGYLSFNGDLNTGLILRTIRLQNGIAEVRVGATVLYDSIPETEAQETLTKAAALFQAIAQTSSSHSLPTPVTHLPEIGSSKKRVLLIDYEDSFVHTLANYIRQTGAEVKTLRHGFPESVFDRESPDLIVLSPGPGNPRDFHIRETIFACLSRQIPIFGVCLGLQAIVEACGGELGILDYPQHGKLSRVRVTEGKSLLFADLPRSFEVGRYHSLYALPDSLPSQLKVTALSEDGVIMAVEHQSLPVAGVQFHPESIMTLAGGVGLAIIENAVSHYAKSEKLLSLPAL